LIKVIIGLGNPSADYEKTRHNAGFWMLDSFSPDWQFESKFHSIVSKIKLKKETLWLLKPTTFMNRSGSAVQAFLNFYQLSLDECLVVHDELDLLPGDIRFKKGGGTGGHNGLKDILNRYSSAPNTDFWRLRVGIGHPRSLGLSQAVVDFVLHPPNKRDQALITQAIDDAQHVLSDFCCADSLSVQQKAIEQLHRRKPS
jgi:PTH1 family peptidyl-tRNA hydrolase